MFAFWFIFIVTDLFLWADPSRYVSKDQLERVAKRRPGKGWVADVEALWDLGRWFYYSYNFVSLKELAVSHNLSFSL